MMSVDIKITIKLCVLTDTHISIKHFIDLIN